MAQTALITGEYWLCKGCRHVEFVQHMEYVCFATNPRETLRHEPCPKCQSVMRLAMKSGEHAGNTSSIVTISPTPITIGVQE